MIVVLIVGIALFLLVGFPAIVISGRISEREREREEIVERLKNFSK